MNCVDLFLVVATCIIQIPPIHNSSVYGWLTIFQILRIYRVIIAIPLTRNLLLRVVGKVWGLVNLIFFLFLITFFSSLLAMQLVRGDIPFQNPDGSYNIISFRSTWNSFLGMYQILSTENWTQNLFNATANQAIYNVGWISATFFILWFVISNNVVVNLFIAVIQEGFDVSEDLKRREQVRQFIQKVAPTVSGRRNTKYGFLHNFLTFLITYTRLVHYPFFPFLSRKF